GFVGESDRENGFGGDALRNEMRHAIGDGAGLAGARARENENGAFSSFRCKTLLGVQSLEKVIHWSVRSKICCAQSWQPRGRRRANAAPVRSERCETIFTKTQCVAEGFRSKSKYIRGWLVSRATSSGM